MKIPRFMIAGTHSGVGKTTITTAILSLLSKKGYKVQPFKVGPDYIDPTYHTAATGNKSRNLDSWMLGENSVRRLFAHSAASADLAVIEGVMGVFDGASGKSEDGSSAHIAKLLDCPVVLIVDVKSMARSAAAVVMGFKNFDPGLNIAGIILNRIGSERHLNLVTEAIETYCDIPVLGYIRKNANLELPSRHLGLVPTIEGGTLPNTVASLSEEIEQGIDIGKLIEVANSALDFIPERDNPEIHSPEICGTDFVRIGIAVDEAFSFYYEDGLDILRSAGAQLVPFSPLHDKTLPPDLQGIYIGGGFPEIFIEQLAANDEIKGAIKKAADSGMPVFAECGGLMYLSRFIIDFDGKNYSMVGIVPGRSVMQNRLAGMGYVTAQSITDNIVSSQGTCMRGHEFHYSRLEPDITDFRYAFKFTRNRSGESVLDGYADKNILASYLHLHFGTNPQLAVNFVNRCRRYSHKAD